MRSTSVVTALILVACPVAVDAGNPQTTAIMKISGVPGQIAIPVDQTDWSQISGLPDPTAPRTTRSTSPLNARGSSSLASRGGTLRGGGGGVAIQDISFVKEVDQSSPKLATACANGELFPKIEIEFVATGGNEREYLVYTLENCVITNITTGLSGDQERPTENVTVSFGEVGWEYRPIKPVQRPTQSFSRPTPSHP